MPGIVRPRVRSRDGATRQRGSAAEGLGQDRGLLAWCFLVDPVAGDADAGRAIRGQRAPGQPVAQGERDERPAPWLPARPAPRPAAASGNGASASAEHSLVQRVELLEPHDRGRGVLPLGPLGEQVPVDLAGAQQHPVDVVQVARVRLADHRPERARR